MIEIGKIKIWRAAIGSWGGKKDTLKDCSYLLLHHHPQRLSPEKNTTECHFLLRLLKNTIQKWDPPAQQEPPTEAFRQHCSHSLPQQRGWHSRPSPPFPFTDIVFVLSSSLASKADLEGKSRGRSGREQLAGLTQLAPNPQRALSTSILFQRAASYFRNQSPLPAHTKLGW